VAPRATGRSSGRRPPTPTSVREFALVGPSDPPDPHFHAYRKDLADIALAGRVIASHYVEPLERVVAAPATLRAAPSRDSEPARELIPGEPFALLEDSSGWAWGYAGAERRVGYVESAALGASAEH
jgi:hypothetical protein